MTDHGECKQNRIWSDIYLPEITVHDEDICSETLLPL